MADMSKISSRAAYTTGTTLTTAGTSLKAWGASIEDKFTVLGDQIAGLTLSDWAIIVGMLCTIGTFALNWYYKRKEFNLKVGGQTNG